MRVASMVRASWVVVGSIGIGVGCAGSARDAQSGDKGTTGRPLVEFPRVEALDAFLDRPVDTKSIDVPEPIDAWTFEDEAPAAPEQAGAWHVVVDELRTRHPEVREAAELDCIAAGAGRVFAEKNRMPDSRLLRDMTARCDSGLPSATTVAVTVEAPASLSDEAAWKLLQDEVRAQKVDALFPRGPSVLGSALVRTQSRATWALDFAPEPVRVEHGLLDVDASEHVVVRGLLRSQFDGIEVVANHGKYGMRKCTTVVRGAEFASKCPIDPADPSAWIEVMSLRSGHVLGYRVARLLAHRAPLSDRYEWAPSGLGTSSSQAFSALALEGVNRARRAARMPLLRWEAKQSVQSDAVGPHLFAAMQSDESQSINTLSLGLLAGWQVQGDIRDGAFFVSMSPGRSPAAWLAESIESPLGRMTLLDPNVQSIALGASFIGERSVQVLANTYRFFAGDHRADEARLLEKFDAARRAQGTESPILLENFAEMDAALLAIQRGEELPTDALRSVMASVAEKGRSNRGGVFEVYDLDRIEFPPEFVREQKVYVSLRVTHYRPPGAAWSQLAVLMFVMPRESA